MAGNKPLGSTLLRNKKKNGKKKNNRNFLNLMKVEADCLTSYDGTTDCSGGGKVGGGTLTADSIQVTDLSDGSTKNPYYAGADPGGAAPPYSYAETDAANCSQLSFMIETVNKQLATTRFASGSGTYEAKQQWLDYATAKYNSSCAVNTTPVTPDPTIDSPSTPITDVSPAQPDVTPTTDSPDVLHTLFPPTSEPYAGGSASPAGSDKATVATKNKNWFWLVVAVLGVTGFVLFKPKKP